MTESSCAARPVRLEPVAQMKGRRLCGYLSGVLSLLAAACLAQVSGQTFEVEPDALGLSPLRVVSFRNEQEGWLVDARGAVFTTTDGGKGWERAAAMEQALGTDARNLSAITWLTPATALAWGRMRHLLRTADGGRTWAVMKVATLVRATSVFSRGSEVWVCGPHKALLHSSDLGATWKPRAGPVQDDDCVGFEMDDRGNGRARESFGAEWVTSDGGATWQHDAGTRPPWVRGTVVLPIGIDLQAGLPTPRGASGSVRIHASDALLLEFRDGDTRRVVRPLKRGTPQRLPIRDITRHQGRWTAIAGRRLLASDDGVHWRAIDTLPDDGRLVFVPPWQRILFAGERTWRWSVGLGWTPGDPAFDTSEARRASGVAQRIENPVACLDSSMDGSIAIDVLRSGCFDSLQWQTRIELRDGEAWASQRGKGRRFLSGERLRQFLRSAGVALTTPDAGSPCLNFQDQIRAKLTWRCGTGAATRSLQFSDDTCGGHSRASELVKLFGELQAAPRALNEVARITRP